MFTYITYKEGKFDAGEIWSNNLNRELRISKRKQKLNELRRKEITEYILKNTKSF